MTARDYLGWVDRSERNRVRWRPNAGRGRKSLGSPPHGDRRAAIDPTYGRWTMTERDLTRLKDLPVPPPRDAAKRAALGAALDAFDKSANNADEPQGSEHSARLTSAPHPAVRRKFMQFTRSQYALAASVAALMIAAPMAFQVTKDDAPNGPFNVVTQKLTDPSTSLSAPSRKDGDAPHGAAKQDGAANKPAELAAESVAKSRRSGNRAEGDAVLATPAKPAEPQVAAVPPPPPASVDEKQATERPKHEFGLAEKPTDGLGAVGGQVAFPPVVAMQLDHLKSKREAGLHLRPRHRTTHVGGPRCTCLDDSGPVELRQNGGI